MKAVIKNGAVIQINEWDYRIEKQENDGVITNKITRPLPEDAVEGDFDIVKTKNGEYVLSSNYVVLRKNEYPPIEDYIDGIVKGNALQVQDYIDKCLAVKAKYPK